EDSDLRYLATLSLGHVSVLSRKRAERELTAALSDRNLRVRAAAALALENLQTAAAQARTQAEEVALLPTETEPVAEEPKPAPKARVEVVRDREVSVAFDDAADETAAIPVLDEEPIPQPRTDPDISGRTYDIDEETIEERRSIGQLRARITPSV